MISSVDSDYPEISSLIFPCSDSPSSEGNFISWEEELDYKVGITISSVISTDFVRSS